jgi:C-terminal processing protease CtpA/Prc
VAQAVNDALQDCSVAGENEFVRTTLRDIYYWYKELPDPDPKTFASPEAYLEAVRYKTLDHTYSFITDRASNDAFFSDSQFIGFGFASTLVTNEDWRVTEVYPASPASEAGLERGAHILVVNGRALASLVSTGDINTIFGPSTVGTVATMQFRDVGGAVHDVQMTKRTVTIPTASLTRTFASGGRVVGYINFRNFVTPATAALDQAFAQLESAGANELVLDLRYNGGGLVSVAQQLASLIGGSRTNGKLFVQFVHNDKNTSKNSTLSLNAPAHALNLERLVVIYTRGSASASELIWNGLRPFIPGDDGRRPQLRQAGGAIRLQLLRQGPLPRGLQHPERARRRAAISTASPPIARPRTTSSTRSGTPPRPRWRKRSRYCARVPAARPRRPRPGPVGSAAAPRAAAAVRERLAGPVGRALSRCLGQDQREA